jgi:DNA-binding MarR family transcriptional regulator
MPKFDYDDYGTAFIARDLHKLRELITQQCDDVFRDENITAPSPAVSTLLYLADVKSCSIARLADDLDYSHQLVNQRLLQLSEMGFVERRADPRDRRRCLIRLTRKGKSEVQKMQEVLPKVSAVFDDIFSGMGVDLQSILREATRLLDAKPIQEQLNNRRVHTKKSSVAALNVNRGAT